MSTNANLPKSFLFISTTCLFFVSYLITNTVVTPVYAQTSFGRRDLSTSSSLRSSNSFTSASFSNSNLSTSKSSLGGSVSSFGVTSTSSLSGSLSRSFSSFGASFYSSSNNQSFSSTNNSYFSSSLGNFVSSSSSLGRTISSSSSFSISRGLNSSKQTPSSAKISLIRQSYVYNSNAGQWEFDNLSSTNRYQVKTCQELYPQGILGIADYQDGLSLSILSKNKNLSQEYISKYRSCQHYNERAGNLPVVCNYTKNQITDPKKTQNTACEVKNSTSSVYNSSTNNPVYVYQYQYRYNFPSAQKRVLSEFYRSQTGLAGDYDGIVWVKNFYTYNTGTSRSIPWENPHENNQNEGWLIYGIRGSVG